MITIYHNPRCRKSREGLEIVENSGEKFEVKEYLKEPPSEKEIRDLLEKLQMKPIQLVRQNEAIWKENYKGKDLSDNELIRVIAENPKLIERPVVIKDNKAVIGRPPSNIENII